MKKIVLLSVLLVALAGTSAFAFSWTDYPEGQAAGNLIVDASIGFGIKLGEKISIPPIHASVDYNLPIGGIPFFVGGAFGIAASKTVSSIGSYGDYTQTWTNLTINARFGYHPNLGVNGLDVYTLISLGYYGYTWKYEYPSGYALSSGNDNFGGFGFGWDIGARYFFLPWLGAFAELGYSSLTFFKIGFAFKF